MITHKVPSKSKKFGIAFLAFLSCTYGSDIPKQETFMPINETPRNTSKDENKKGHIKTSVQYNLPPVRKEVDLKEKESFYDLLNKRMSYNIKNNFTIMNLNDYALDSEKNRMLIEDSMADRVKNSMKRGAIQAFRQHTLELITIDDYIINRLDFFGSKMIDAFKGGEEKNTLVSPFNKEEGIPGLEKYEVSRLPRRWDWGIRPFRTNPYAFITGKIGDSRTHLRASMEDVEILWQKPLTDKYSISIGYKENLYDKEKGTGFFGISGYLKEGYISLGAIVNGNNLGFSIGYSKIF
ncbi:MAG: hypothetical protein AABW65_01665 [Nanoarchaeota archaeon]